LAEIGLCICLLNMVIHALNYWVFKRGNVPQLAISNGYNALLVVLCCLAKKYRKSHYIPVTITLTYLIFQLVWINICIRDLLSPTIVLDKSDTTIFEYYHHILIAVTILNF